MALRGSSCVKLRLAVGLLATPIVASFTPALYAQATASGAIAGAITDSSGAAIVGASVTATKTETNAVGRDKTNAAGEFRFDLLPVAHYTIPVQAPGFSAGQI